MKLYSKGYLDETDINISSDILSRKEFYIFKKSAEVARFTSKLQEINDHKNIIPKFLLTENAPASNYLELKSYQMLTRNYINPNTPYSRLLLKWETGHGKTIAAIAIALNFIEYYKKDAGPKQVGSVYVIGFTQTIFKDELLKYPEFGFITRDELVKLNNLKKLSYGSVQNNEKLRKFITVLKKRLYNRRNNGFFKFIGYKELANNLFIGNKHDLTSMTELEINEGIKNNTIKINKGLLASFSNSLLICDEIHNVYNTYEKNNWGIALQVILNTHNSCRALFLSATPLNNSPTEIIDLLNLLLPRKYYPCLNKNDFFTVVNKIQIVKKSKVVELSNYLKGRVSFIRDRNPAFISTRKLMGVSIPGIQNLKFIRCPMSKFHYNTYKEIYNDNVTMGQDGQYLVDCLLPDPGVTNPFKSKELGLYKTKEIKEKITNAPLAWQQKYGIYYNNAEEIIKGTILRKETLGNISNKYLVMINMILKNIKETRGKMFIYHNYIHMTGTLFLQQILLENNIIGEFDNSSNNTLCICGNKKKDHAPGQLEYVSDLLHYFQPVRFAIVHSNLEKPVISKSLEKFNSVDNITGSNILILIGSKIMKESHSINSVRNILIMSRPDNISTLIQIIGRAIRLNSHKLLPKKQQHVDINIFVSSVPGLKELSYEENKYKEKLQMFKVIQQIEKIMHINAIDAYFNYDTIFGSQTDDFELDILPYTLEYNAKFTPQELNLSTFNVYYAKFEIDYVIYMIKRLFIEISQVWTYKDLFSAVKLPPFSIEINPVISQEMFNIALNTVIYVKSLIYVEPNITDLSMDLVSTNILDKIQNPDDKIVLNRNDVKYVITQIGDLYSLVPIYNEETFIDVESVYRSLKVDHNNYVDIMQYLKYDSNDDYKSKKIKFITKWKFTNIIDLEQSLCDFGITFHANLLENIITYMFNIWTQPNQKKDENHAFYLKMLYFYDLQKLVAWAHTVPSTLKIKYAKYITPVSLTLLKDIKLQNNDVATNEITASDNDGETNQLIMSLNHGDKQWLSAGLIKEYNENLHESDKLFGKVYKKTAIHPKVRADLLPVGHYLKKVAQYYLPSGWYDFISLKSNIKENNIIVGFDQRSKTGISVKFKLRNPVHKLKNSTDTRLNETGTVCNTKSKFELKSIANLLHIPFDPLLNTEDICGKIRNKLIYLEIKERVKAHPVRYFYNVLEHDI